jgi:hypothetical protein
MEVGVFDDLPCVEELNFFLQAQKVTEKQ